jgi:parvulin-like peptidyl-prolyl isomerase
MNFSRLLPILAALTFLTPAGLRAAEVIDGLAAAVNGKVITLSQVRQAIAVRIQVEQMGNSRNVRTREQFEAIVGKIEQEALQDLIDRELILDEFKAKGGVIKPTFIDDSIDKFVLDRFDGDRRKFVTELRETGMTLQSFREMREDALVVQYMRSSQTRDMPPPTPSERVDWYKKNLDRFRGKDYVNLRTITIPKATGLPDTTPASQRALLDEIRKKIVEGADFGLMAKTYSEDSKARKGGDWGTIERDDFKPLLSDTAFKLKPQTVSEILEDEKNLYLLWVEAAERGGVTPLEEIREDVDRFVMQEKRKAAHDKWMERLREKANIQIFDRFTSTR